MRSLGTRERRKKIHFSSQKGVDARFRARFNGSQNGRHPGAANAMKKRTQFSSGLVALLLAPLLCAANSAFAALPAVGSGSVLLHLKADAANVTLGPGNAVTQWSDLSGLNNHFTQTNATRQPTWVPGVLNGRPTIRFDGTGGSTAASTSDWLQADGAGLNTPDRTLFTFFAVTYDTADPFSLFDSATRVQNPFRFGAFGAGFPTPRFNVEFWDRSPGVALSLNSAGSVISIAGSRDGSNNRVLDVREMSTLGTTNTSGVGNTNPVRWGGNAGGLLGANANANPKIGTINGGDGGFYYDGDVAELVIYNGTLNAADRAAVENYLRDEYALQFVPPPPTSASGLGHYGGVVLATEPVAYWRLETNSSPPLDDANQPGFPQQGSQDGMYQDINPHHLGQPGPRPTDSIGGRPLAGFAADNHAAQFQGSRFGGNDVALFPDDGNLNMSGGGAFTLEAWVKAPSAQADGDGAAVIAKGAGGGDEQFAIDIVGGAYRFFAWDGQIPNNLPAVLQTTARPDDTWQHVVAVMDIGEGRMEFYVNGQLVGSQAPRASIVNNLHEVSVGARQAQGSVNYDHNLDGLVDEVAIYGYALSAEQVAAHYEAAFVPEPSTTVLVVIGGVLLAGGRRFRRRRGR
jgi:hypothetical protein